MSNYFRYLPRVDYQLRIANNTVQPTVRQAVNLTARAIFRETVNRVAGNEGITYYPYRIQDDDRPDLLSRNYYDEEKYVWVIFYANDIFDPLHDWPKTQRDLNAFIEHKYGSISAAQSTNAEFEGIIQEKTVLFDGTIIDERVVKLDEVGYNAFEGNKRIITAYEKEERDNDLKRNIRLLRKSLLPKVQRELEEIFVEGSILSSNSLYSTSLNSRRSISSSTDNGGSISSAGSNFSSSIY